MLPCMCLLVPSHEFVVRRCELAPYYVLMYTCSFGTFYIRIHTPHTEGKYSRTDIASSKGVPSRIHTSICSSLRQRHRTTQSYAHSWYALFVCFAYVGVCTYSGHSQTFHINTLRNTTPRSAAVPCTIRQQSAIARMLYV